MKKTEIHAQLDDGCSTMMVADTATDHVTMINVEIQLIVSARNNIKFNLKLGIRNSY